MKKLLVILMVVAMASFLFVGCLPGTTTPVVEEEEEEVVVVPPTTVAPIIIAVDAGAVVNKVEAANGIIVNGTAPTYSEVKIYINDICAGTGDTTVVGEWVVVVAKADLGADGDKVLYATAKEPGLDVSAKSNEKKFTLDTGYPKIKSVKARAGVAAVAAAAGDVPVGTTALSAGPTVVTAANVVTGTWTVNINAVAGTTFNVSLTDPDGIVNWYTSGDADNFAADAPIPGVSFTLAAALAPGQCSQIVCVAAAAAVRGVVSLTYDEDLSWTGAVTNGVYTIWNNATAANILLVNTAFWAYNEATDTMFWRETVAGAGIDLTQGDFLTFQVDSATDLAENPIPLATPETATTVVLASTIVITP